MFFIEGADQENLIASLSKTPVPGKASAVGRRPTNSRSRLRSDSRLDSEFDIIQSQHIAGDLVCIRTSLLRGLLIISFKLGPVPQKHTGTPNR